jgi:hypothetical protein
MTTFKVIVIVFLGLIFLMVMAMLYLLLSVKGNLDDYDNDLQIQELSKPKEPGL